MIHMVGVGAVGAGMLVNRRMMVFGVSHRLGS